MIIRLLGPMVDISTANDVGTAKLVRICNHSSDTLLNVSYANGVIYSNTHVMKGESFVIEKNPTDKLTASGLMAVPVAYRG